jgi:hypothetical protein
MACGEKGATTPGVDAAAPDADAENTGVTIKTFAEGVPFSSGRTENAMLVAFQDGDGPWVELSGVGVYRASPVSARYGVAVGCVATRSRVDIHYLATSDTREVLATGCAGIIETARLSVDLKGVLPDELGEVWVGRGAARARGGGAFALDAPKEVADVFARSFSQSPSGGTNNVKAYRGATLDVQSDAALPIDMAASRPIEFHPLTITGLGTGIPDNSLSVRSTFVTKNSHVQWSLHTGSVNPSTTPLDSYATLDATMRQPDDVYSVLVVATAVMPTIAYSRTARAAFKDGGAQTVDLPDIIDVAPPVREVGTPNITVTIPVVPSRLGYITYQAILQGSATIIADRTWTLSFRPGWTAGRASIVVTTPDLSALPGWRPEMSLPAGLGWNIGWTDSNMPVGTPAIDGRRSIDSRVTSVNGAL